MFSSTSATKPRQNDQEELLTALVVPRRVGLLSARSTNSNNVGNVDLVHGKDTEEGSNHNNRGVKDPAGGIQQKSTLPSHI
eukprot:scaffold16470_cov137-Amphora_coffeaeformis.AAC.1